MSTPVSIGMILFFVCWLAAAICIAAGVGWGIALIVLLIIALLGLALVILDGVTEIVERKGLIKGLEAVMLILCIACFLSFLCGMFALANDPPSGLQIGMFVGSIPGALVLIVMIGRDVLSEKHPASG